MEGVKSKRSSRDPGRLDDAKRERHETSCATSDAAEHPCIDIVFASPLFPLYAMRVADFIGLPKLHSYNELLKMGLLVPLDLHGEHKGASINFISHEWLGDDEADPEGVHLRTMQDVFRRVIAGENVFRSEDHWKAYSQGFHARAASSGRFDPIACFEALDAASRTQSEFQASIELGYVWMDFISIPQTVRMRSEDTLRTALEGQARAIRSIPYYIKHAGNFWICAPSATKKDGMTANYESWAARGWCRLEDVTNTLTNLGDGRALLVTHPFGEPPALISDTILVYSQRYNAVLTGAYSCCQKGHETLLADGTRACVRCDREAIRELLAKLYDATMHTLRTDFWDDTTLRSLGSIWDCVMQKNISFHKYVQLSVTKPMLLAESLDEPDWIALGWSVPFDRIGEAELSAYWAHYGLQWPQPASAMVIPALEGNLPMLRYFIESVGCSPAVSSPTGLTPLIGAARGGHLSVVCYLCQRLDIADIDFQMESSGMSALADAAMRNHPKVLRELLKHGARADIRRQDGKTPFLLAMSRGHVQCARILLAAGADPSATDYDGRSACNLMKLHLINPEISSEISSLQGHTGPPVASTGETSALTAAPDESGGCSPLDTRLDIHLHPAGAALQHKSSATFALASQIMSRTPSYGYVVGMQLNSLHRCSSSWAALKTPLSHLPQESLPDLVAVSNLSESEDVPSTSSGAPSRPESAPGSASGCHSARSTSLSARSTSLTRVASYSTDQDLSNPLHGAEQAYMRFGT